MVMNLVHFWLIFQNHLIALITHYYLQNFMDMEYHMHLLTWSFHIMRVELNITNCFSKRSNTDDGVPQGSILGSLFLNINLINIFYKCEDSDTKNYTDDTTAYTSIRDTESVISRGHSIVTFALRERGGFHQNANVCKQGGRGCHIIANVRI